MINLIYTVLLFNILIILFKLFQRYNINTLQALIINYLTSAVLSFIYLENDININELIDLNWISYPILIGSIFMISFYLFSYGIQKIGISITTISSKMSVIIPVSTALILYPNETLTTTKIFALVFAMIGIYLSSIKKGKINLSRKFLFIILLIFLSQGVADSIFNDFIQKYPDNNNYAFFMILFLIASLSGILILGLESTKGHHKLQFKNLLSGVIFGIPNFFSLVFFIQALKEMESSIVFPLVSMGIIVSSTLIAILIFKERINKNNWIGVISSIIAIYLFI